MNESDHKAMHDAGRDHLLREEGEVVRRGHTMSAPCNICGVAWPHHVPACSYAVTLRERDEARAALAVSERNQQTLRDALEAFDERWYPQLAGTALGEAQLGHSQSAERWAALCRDWRGIAALGSLSGPQPADTHRQGDAP